METILKLFAHGLLIVVGSVVLAACGQEPDPAQHVTENGAAIGQSAQPMGENEIANARIIEPSGNNDWYELSEEDDDAPEFGMRFEVLYGVPSSDDTVAVLTCMDDGSVRYAMAWPYGGVGGTDFEVRVGVNDLVVETVTRLVAGNEMNPRPFASFHIRDRQLMEALAAGYEMTIIGREGAAAEWSGVRIPLDSWSLRNFAQRC